MLSEWEKKYDIFYRSFPSHNIEVMKWMLIEVNGFLERFELDKYITFLEVYSHAERVACVFNKDSEAFAQRGEYLLFSFGQSRRDNIFIETEDIRSVNMSIFDKNITKEIILKEYLINKKIR